VSADLKPELHDSGMNVIVRPPPPLPDRPQMPSI
jgi:hypothetical protein